MYHIDSYARKFLNIQLMADLQRLNLKPVRLTRFSANLTDALRYYHIFQDLEDVASQISCGNRNASSSPSVWS